MLINYQLSRSFSWEIFSFSFPLSSGSLCSPFQKIKFSLPSPFFLTEWQHLATVVPLLGPSWVVHPFGFRPHLQGPALFCCCVNSGFVSLLPCVLVQPSFPLIASFLPSSCFPPRAFIHAALFVKAWNNCAHLVKQIHAVFIQISP